MEADQINSSKLNSAFSKLESTKPKENLAEMFDSMQISVIGGQNDEEHKSDNVSQSERSDEELDDG